MTLITREERALWQRRAAAELGRILAAHPDLPCISWTVGPAGSVVAGQVSGLAPAGRVRHIFTTWRSALELEEYREQRMSSGTVWLHAAVRRCEVTVRLTAAVFDDEGRESCAGQAIKPSPPAAQARSTGQGTLGCWGS